MLHTLKTKFPHLSIAGKRIIPFLMEEADVYKNLLALNYAANKSRKSRHENATITSARTELTELLEQKLDNNLKRIFWLLGLTYPSGTILPLYKDIRNEDPDIRISTVELLDNILEPGLKKVVISIVESAMQDQLSEDDFERLEVDVPSEISCYQSILNGNDQQLKAAVQKLIEAINDPKMEELLSTTSKA